MTPNLLITMPAHDGRNATETTRSLWALARTDIPHWPEFLNRETSWVYRQMCCELFCSRTEYSHWLSLDSDVAFTPSVVMRMLAADRDIISAVYLTRSRPRRPTVVMLPEHPAAPHDGAIMPVRFTPLGMSLISRAAITLVAEHYPRTVRVRRPCGDLSIHRWFETDVLDGDLLEPDYAFQHRWRCVSGGHVYAYFPLPTELQHVGNPL